MKNKRLIYDDKAVIVHQDEKYILITPDRLKLKLRDFRDAIRANSWISFLIADIGLVLTVLTTEPKSDVFGIAPQYINGAIWLIIIIFAVLSIINIFKLLIAWLARNFLDDRLDDLWLDKAKKYDCDPDKIVEHLSNEE